jgi:hypothetical protein
LAPADPTLMPTATLATARTAAMRFLILHHLAFRLERPCICAASLPLLLEAYPGGAGFALVLAAHDWESYQVRIGLDGDFARGPIPG